MALHSVQALCPSLDGEVKIGKCSAARFEPSERSELANKTGGPALSWQQRSKIGSLRWH